jgi:hypothetical protein
VIVADRCPYCAEPLREAGERCPFCGESLLKGSPCKLHPKELIDATCKTCAEYVCLECRDVETGGCVHCQETQVDAKKHYDFGRILGAVTKDPDWVTHVLIGGACMLGGSLIVPLLILMGYRLRIVRGQRKRPDLDRLPDWSNVGELLDDGFKFVLAHMLPLLAALVPLGAAVVVGAILLDESNGHGAAAGVGLALVIGALCLYVLLALFYTYASPAIELEYLETGSPTCGFRLGALRRRMFTRAVDYLILFLFHYLIQQILSGLGIILCFVGIYFTAPWAMFADGILMGRYLAKEDQAKREAAQAGGEADVEG